MKITPLKEARMVANLSQTDLGTQCHISKIENGEVQPKSQTAIRIARILGIRVSDFWDLWDQCRLHYLEENLPERGSLEERELMSLRALYSNK